MEFLDPDGVLEMPRGPDPWGRRSVGTPQAREGLATHDGRRLEVPGLDVLDFRDGKVVRKDSYWEIVE